MTLGTGGVSVFALQFARMHGASVIATSSSDGKLTRMEQLGAAHCVNYRSHPEWAVRAHELVGDQSIDHVVEVGGAGTLARSIQAARVGGRISLIGVLTGVAAEVNPVLVMRKSLTVQGIYVGSRTMFENMTKAMILHQTHPVIDRVFALADMRDALKHMRAGGHFGKIVVAL